MAGYGVQPLQTMTQTSDTDFACQKVSSLFPCSLPLGGIVKTALAEYECL